MMQKTPLALALAATFLLAGCGDSDNDPVVDAPVTGKPMSLTVLHINDHHSNLDEASSALDLKRNAAGEREEVKIALGGFPRVTATMNALAAGHDNVLKLHAGDAVTGTLYFTLEEGKADADLMNTVCFDATAVGNHEFDSGDAGLKKFVDFLHADGACRTPMLSANVTPGAASPLGNAVQPSTVVERDGEKIGIVGLTVAAKTQNSSRPDAGTVLGDERAAAQAEIDRLTAQGANKIVVLSHIGYAADRALAAQLKGVDIIVGGDSHSLLGPASMRDYGLSPAGDYPTRVSNADGDTVCVVQAWQYAAVVGELTVDFDEAGRVTACEGTPHVLIGDSFGEQTAEQRAAIDADIAASGFLRVTAPDAAAQAKLEPYKQALSAFGDVVVANAPANLCLRRVPGTTRDASRSRLPGCNEDPSVIAHGGDVQQLVADAFLNQGKLFGGADASLQNGGGVRVDVSAGDVTVGDIYTVLPFDNTLVTLTMTGAEIKSAIEDALQNVATGSTGAYPYAGALRWHVDMNQAHGSRVSALEIRAANGAWGAIDPTASYRVITNDFIADGQDGYTTLGTVKGERREDTFLAYADAFFRYAQQNPTLARPAASEFSTQVFVDTP